MDWKSSEVPGPAPFELRATSPLRPSLMSAASLQRAQCGGAGQRRDGSCGRVHHRGGPRTALPCGIGRLRRKSEGAAQWDVHRSRRYRLARDHAALRRSGGTPLSAARIRRIAQLRSRLRRCTAVDIEMARALDDQVQVKRVSREARTPCPGGERALGQVASSRTVLTRATCAHDTAVPSGNLWLHL